MTCISMTPARDIATTSGPCPKLSNGTLPQCRSRKSSRSSKWSFELACCRGIAGQECSAAQLSTMAKREFSGREILAGEAPQDAPVTIKGWVRTRRDSKAGISFVHLSDGSSFHPVQVVAPNTLPNYTDEVLKLSAGCAVEATGTIVPSPAKGQPFEMQASALRVIGWVEDPDTYPIQIG